MCIAIYKPENKLISKETLQECFRSNSDGAGFMWAEGRKLHIEKGFFTFDSFYEEYQKVEQKKCVIHFRIKTHGQISSENCHPFLITNNTAFVHNGVISGYNDTVKSDTLLFQEQILSPMIQKYGRRLLQDPEFKELVENFIGWSKLIFLDANGQHIIYNEQKGSWDDGVWYSNNSYKPAIIHTWKGKDVDYGHYSGPVLIPNNGSKTTVMPDHGKTFYLKKANGYHIYQGDWVKLNYKFRTLEVDDVFEVIKVEASAHCTLESPDGTLHYNVPGALISLYYPATDQPKLTNDWKSE